MIKELGAIIALAISLIAGGDHLQLQKLNYIIDDQIEDLKIKSADIEGMILDITEDGKYILVDSVSEMVNGEVWIAINEETCFFEKQEGHLAIGYKDVSREFKVGNYVQIDADDGIMESYPMQAIASKVYVNKTLNPNEILGIRAKQAEVYGEVLEVCEEEGRILVQSKSDGISEPIWVSITEETNFFEQSEIDINGEEVRFNLVSNEFEVGNYVALNTNSIILESYPAQTEAKEVYINKRICPR